ncbi:MAG: Dabb family protein [Proteobacteria bacterium]|nr:Dabb family protein [Pseudomonadota bacterium]HQR03046.1 Dabb family protein [Rhodocyclaceae bacterium]
MIKVQDRIEVAADNLPRLQELFAKSYIPAAAARGLILTDSAVSPPLVVSGRSLILWIHWQLADTGAFWGARAIGGADPEVAAFWAGVDRLCSDRERIYLLPDQPAQAAAVLPRPVDITSSAITPRGWRETAQLYLKAGNDDAARRAVETALAAAAGLPGLDFQQWGANMVTDFGAGHYTWDLIYPDAATARAARASAVWQQNIMPVLHAHCAHWSALGLQTLGAGLRDPKLQGGVKRTALFRRLAGSDDARAPGFEVDTLEMPAHIESIRNWRLSRAIALDWDSGHQSWDYVWEQEYASLDGLMGPYMMHPHHWAYVDRAFDPESGRQFIDVRLCHAFCSQAESLMAREAP